MARTTISGGWASVATAPRDGTPLVLWMLEDETLPEVPLSVGFWTLNPKASLFGGLRSSAFGLFYRSDV